VSRTFARPESSKIAIKVINHYGDEVLKVFEMRRVTPHPSRATCPAGPLTSAANPLA
jgi:hypothetical protein